MAKSQQSIVPVHDPLVEEQKFTVDLGKSVLEMLAKVPAFFKEAKRLEVLAKAQLETAKTLKPAKTVAEDEALQRRAQSIATEKKTILAHWSVTSVLFNLHKRMVGARTRATLLLDEASDIVNRHHNAYVTQARAAAQKATDDARRAEELRAQEDRNRELDLLEQSAIEAESKMTDLSDRELTFVDLYVAGQQRGDAAAVAKSVGFRNPDKAAARLLSEDKILAAIKAKREAVAIRQQAAAVKDQPLDMDVPNIRPNVSRSTGAHDRTTHSAVVLDEVAMINAVAAGRIPGITAADICRIDPAKLNQYARALQEKLNLWNPPAPAAPFVKHVGTTRVV